MIPYCKVLIHILSTWVARAEEAFWVVSGADGLFGSAETSG